MQMIKGFAAGLVALVACPCHLPLTIPALLLLTSGTALGVWLIANQWFIWTASTLLFVGSLLLAFFWLGRAAVDDQCEVPTDGQARVSHVIESSATTQQAERIGSSQEVSNV